jgi:hypothetical protein
MNELAPAPGAIDDALDVLARAGNYPLLARSLFLWNQILGPACPAGQRLREMTRDIVALPLGSDIAEQSVWIRPQPDGFDIHPAALPGADAVFAFVTEPGLRLVMFSEATTEGRVVRRLQLRNASGALYRRRGPERFMLRYRLDPVVLRANDLLLISLVQEAGARPAALPALRGWIEIDRGGQRQFVSPAESSAGMLAEGEVARIDSFAPGAVGAAAGVGEATGIFLYLELVGETVDAHLLGEALIA